MLKLDANGDAAAQSVRIGEGYIICDIACPHSPLISIIFGCVQKSIGRLRSVNGRGEKSAPRVAPSLIEVNPLTGWDVLDELIRKVSIEISDIEKSIEIKE